MEARRRRVGVAQKATFRVGQHVRISKENVRFAKADEQNISTEVVKVAKVIERRPRAVYEHEDLNGRVSTASFIARKTPVRITDRTSCKIDNIIDKKVRRGIRVFLVRWRAYSKEFDSSVPATGVKII